MKWESGGNLHAGQRGGKQLELRQLRYFQTIAREKQITRAAKKLHMAQPPLSQSLKALETELGVKLMERNGRKMELTDAGVILYQKINHLFDYMEETVTEVKDIGGGMKGTLAIGCVKTCFPQIPKKLQFYHHKYPHIQFQLSEGDSYLLAEQLLQRTIDVAVIRLPLEMNAFASLSLPTENYVAVIPETWSNVSETITINELSELPLLLLHRISGRGQYELIVEQFEKRHLYPDIVCECPDVDMILQLVSEEMGATIIPESTVLAHHLQGLKQLTIKDHTFTSHSAIIWLKDRYLPKSARQFIELFETEK